MSLVRGGIKGGGVWGRRIETGSYFTLMVFNRVQAFVCGRRVVWTLRYF